MAAQPNFWGTMGESTASGRIPPQRETNTPEKQGLHYRQIFSERRRDIASADFSSEVVAEARNSLATTILGDAPRRAEALDGNPLAIILVAIDKLMSPDEDGGDPPATEHAYRNTRAVVESAYGLLLGSKEPQAQGPPIPIVTTDERGGVRLSWQSGDRHVRTNFAAAEGLRSYLYFESPAEHDVQALQPYTLSGRLAWMLNA